MQENFKGFFCNSVMHSSMSFFESRINWAFAFSPKMAYFASLSGPVAVENYVIVDNNQSLMITKMKFNFRFTVTLTGSLEIDTAILL
jgi:hypothetical protein